MSSESSSPSPSKKARQESTAHNDEDNTRIDDDEEAPAPGKVTRKVEKDYNDKEEYTYSWESEAFGTFDLEEIQWMGEVTTTNAEGEDTELQVQIETSADYTNYFLKLDMDQARTAKEPPAPTVAEIAKLQDILDHLEDYRRLIAKEFWACWNRPREEGKCSMWWDGNLKMVQEGYHDEGETCPNSEEELWERTKITDLYILPHTQEKKSTSRQFFLDFDCGPVDVEHYTGAMFDWNGKLTEFSYSYKAR